MRLQSQDKRMHKMHNNSIIATKEHVANIDFEHIEAGAEVAQRLFKLLFSRNGLGHVELKMRPRT